MVPTAFKAFVGIAQTLKEVAPDIISPLFSVVSLVNETIDGYQDYKVSLNTFYNTLSNALEGLRVNQFHNSYPEAKKAIDEAFSIIKQQYNVIHIGQDKRSLKKVIDKGNAIITSSKLNEDLERMTNFFESIIRFIPPPSSYNILNNIYDCKAASFWNNIIGNTLNVSYDHFLNCLRNLLGPGSTEGLRNGKKHFEIIFSDQFNYVVCWLGGWNEFLEYIKKENPFTDSFFREAAKELKPPFSASVKQEDNNIVRISPLSTYYKENCITNSLDVSYAVLYKKKTDTIWKISDTDIPGINLTKAEESYDFRIFSIEKKTGLVSRECLCFSTEAVDGCIFKLTDFVKSSQGTFTSKKDLYIPALPLSKSLMSYLINIPCGVNTSIFSGIRPTLYVSDAAYSLAKKLGYFFSPNILFWLWKRPEAIKTSKFAAFILNGREDLKDFVYHTLLKYNHQHNETIKSIYKWFNWEPEYNEEKLRKATEYFECEVSATFAKEVEEHIKKFSKELGTVIIEYLDNPDILKLCSSSLCSSIVGYYGPPDTDTLKGIRSGTIVVLKQTIMGYPSIYMKQSLDDLKTTGVSKYSFLDNVGQLIQLDGSGSWVCTPRVVMPGQIPVSLVETDIPIFFDEGARKINTKDMIKWMTENPPKAICNGLSFSTELETEFSLWLSRSLEFYTIGDFALEIKDISRTILSVEFKDGSFNVNGSSMPGTSVIFPKGYANSLCIGFKITLAYGTLSITDIDGKIFKYSLNGCRNTGVNVVFPKGKLAISNLHYT